MSTALRAEPSTAVATRPDRDDALTREGKLHMAQIRATRALTVAITNEAWGNALTPQMRHAVAEYMRRHRLDVGEVDILGGKIYKNGYYYRRRVAEMRTAGKVEHSEGDNIGPDARLDAMIASDDEEARKWAQTENFRRMRERIRWAVPEDATHAYVVRVKLKTDQKVLEGCDWITPLRKNKFGKVADPIGADEPEKTVITRAWRRCGLLVAAEIPELRASEETLAADAEIVEATIEQIADEENARETVAGAAPRMLARANPDDPYTTENDDAPEPPAEESPAPTGGAAARDAAVAIIRDLAWAEVYPNPFNRDYDLHGKPFGELGTKHLEQLERWIAGRQEQRHDLTWNEEPLAAIRVILEARKLGALGGANVPKGFGGSVPMAPGGEVNAAIGTTAAPPARPVESAAAATTALADQRTRDDAERRATEAKEMGQAVSLITHLLTSDRLTPDERAAFLEDVGDPSATLGGLKLTAAEVSSLIESRTSALEATAAPDTRKATDKRRAREG